MHQYFMNFLRLYLANLDQIGIPGAGVLLAILVPGEMIVPPVAYLEANPAVHGLGGAILNTALLVMVSALGYTVGCAILYWVARGIGRPLLVRFGKYILIPEKKLKLAESWMERFGVSGLIFGTLIPGVRHVICLPAGLVGMRFRTFFAAVFVGALILCTLLAVFGLVMSSQMAALIAHGGNVDSPEYRHALHTLSLATGGLIVVVATTYVLAIRKAHSHIATPEHPPETPIID